MAVAVATDGLVMRSKPEVSSTSQMYTPALPEGAQVYVLGGPTTADGHDWYEVLPLSAEHPGRGWVASASRSGEPWIAPATATCPTAPTTLASLRAMSDGLALACFSRVPLTVEALLQPCDCSVDGPVPVPAWFGMIYTPENQPALGFGPLVLREPGAPTPPDPGEELFLNLDPAIADFLPIGNVVEATGMFDHPAAAECRYAPDGETAGPSDICRFRFAVTDLEVNMPD